MKQIITLTTLALLVIGCSEKKETVKEVAIPKVTVKKIKATEEKESLTYSGTIEADNTVSLGLSVPGRISKVNVQEGQKLFTEVLDGCRWMTDALFLLKGSLKQRNGFMELGPEWEDLESQYSSVVNELVTAFEANDTLLLADVLEYELLNNLDGWVGVFEKIDHKMDVNSL